MAVEYAAFCDDFYVNMRLGTQMPLPTERGTLLSLFEQAQKAFPTMTRFRRAEGEHSIEEERVNNCYRWLSVETNRLASGHVNPASIQEAMRLHQFVIELAPYQLGISPVEIDYLDILFGFDLEFKGNHDELITETLLSESPLAGLLEESGARVVDCQPSLTFALSEDCRLQARLDLVSRTNSYHVRTGDFPSEVISVYLFVRRFWGDRPKRPEPGMLDELCEHCERLTQSYLLPRLVKPLQSAIASRS
jgi:hypothetical protein